MSRFTTPKYTPHFDEDDNDYQVIARRNSERRCMCRRDTRLQFITHDKIRKLRQLDNNSLIQLRLGDRRSQERRTSRPKFLTISEIMRLRKQNKSEP